MYQRTEIKEILRRLAEPRRHLIVLSGPRQIGKTTLIRQALKRQDRPNRYTAADEPSPQSPSIDSSNPLIGDSGTMGMPKRGTGEWLSWEWERARAEAGRSERGFVLALDEIHKVPRWSETVKGLWDADTRMGVDMRVILLGSSPLLMGQAMSESLAGRFESLHLSHWSFAEMHDAFGLTLERYLYFGGYPGSTDLINDEPRWRDYLRQSLIEPNIDKDILQMTRVEKPALLRRLFELGCAYSGQILAYNKMLGQLQDAGNTTTLSHYLELLAKAELLIGLHKYAGKQHRRRASSPKLNVLNSALMTALSGYAFAEAKADRSWWGRLVESAVGAHLYNTRGSECRLYYWRQSPYEVDFVLERGEKRIPIEVKSGTRPAKTMGLTQFKKEFGVYKEIVVGGDGIPLEEFLVCPASDWFESW